jgi:hypothetical protein
MVKGCVARAAQLCRLNGLTAKSHAITCAVLITMDEYTPKDRKKRKRKVATQLLDDLTTYARLQVNKYYNAISAI